MPIDDAELRRWRQRWRDAKYQAVRDALVRALPQSEWMDACDAVGHPADKRLANDLRGARLCDQDLKDLDLGDSLLDAAEFDRSRFDGAQFQWAVMNGASFRHCTFRLTQMIIVFGEAIDFHGATFDDAFIDHAQIKKSNFSAVAMQGGTLSNSDVRHGDFSGMRFIDGKFKSNDARFCDFSRARFVGCRFAASRLDASCLVGASFERCDLSGVDFRGADLKDADFLGGTFWSMPEESAMARTKFDDTSAARRVVERSTAAGKAGIEWCAVAPDSRID